MDAEIRSRPDYLAAQELVHRVAGQLGSDNGGWYSARRSERRSSRLYDVFEIKRKPHWYCLKRGFAIAEIHTRSQLDVIQVGFHLGENINNKQLKTRIALTEALEDMGGKVDSLPPVFLISGKHDMNEETIRGNGAYFGSADEAYNWASHLLARDS